MKLFAYFTIVFMFLPCKMYGQTTEKVLNPHTQITCLNCSTSEYDTLDLYYFHPALLLCSIIAYPDTNGYTISEVKYYRLVGLKSSFPDTDSIWLSLERCISAELSQYKIMPYKVKKKNIAISRQKRYTEKGLKLNKYRRDMLMQHVKHIMMVIEFYPYQYNDKRIGNILILEDLSPL